MTSVLTPEERENLLTRLRFEASDEEDGPTIVETMREAALALQHALEEIDELRERLRVLSMLVLQSDLYRRDPEVRDAVDNGLAALKEIR